MRRTRMAVSSFFLLVISVVWLCSPLSSHNIGFTAVTFLIFNRIVGTGIFATPALILRSAGSIGGSLVLWIIGAAYAAAGTAVYVELGTALPQSGGEKVYLSATWPQPRFLVSSAYAAYATLFGWSAANSVVCSEYLLHALGVPWNSWNVRVLATVCLTSIAVLHGVSVRWGVRLQNVLGVFKLLALAAVGVAGVAIITGLSRVPPARDNFRRPFEGTTTDANAIGNGLYKVVWCEKSIGYSNANSALGEVRNPVRTLKGAAPLALSAVCALYVAINMAYFSAVPKDDILRGGTTVAALFFRLVLGEAAEKVLSILIAISAYATVLSVMFAHSRINQAIAQDGIVPFARTIATTGSWGTPLGAILVQYLVSLVIIVAAPPGDAYNLIINVVSYPLAVVNLFISIGLLRLRATKEANGEPKWSPPYRAGTSVVVFFAVGNGFLSFAPLIPPADGAEPYQSLPYWLHVAIGLTVFALGVLYWLAWRIVLPYFGRYRLTEKQVILPNGQRVLSFTKEPAS
ncbi:amino acid transporter [Auriculariales sp. MPI-PUGE-AT-0066]|nr:amino acid transporter [Auriculariales sp. MPI-PUGE-AT-0066]